MRHPRRIHRLLDCLHIKKTIAATVCLSLLVPPQGFFIGAAWAGFQMDRGGGSPSTSGGSVKALSEVPTPKSLPSMALQSIEPGLGAAAGVESAQPLPSLSPQVGKEGAPVASPAPEAGSQDVAMNVPAAPVAAQRESRAAPSGAERAGSDSRDILGYWRDLKSFIKLPGLAAFDGGRVAPAVSEPALSPAADIPALASMPAGKDAGPARTRADNGDNYRFLKELKQVLGDGAYRRADPVTPFEFHIEGKGYLARGVGLEGFLYSKLELEKRNKADLTGQWEDFFKYFHKLLAPFPWAAEMDEGLNHIQGLDLDASKKNILLNQYLILAVKRLREAIQAVDPSLWGREAHTYTVFARAYNRLRPGSNFFDSLDERELARIRDEVKADQIWLIDVLEIGELSSYPAGGPWGTGGGSPYAVKGYRRIKPELGGIESFQRFIRRAQRMGLRVRMDFIPNHTSLDSELMEQHPEAYLHILPPQHLSDGEIMQGVPREINNSYRTPLFFLIKTRNYPGRIGQETKVLIHHPKADAGSAVWIDMGQLDYTQPAAREWLLSQALFLFQELGIDSVRRDMAYYVTNRGYHDRWVEILEREKNSASGWAQVGIEKMIAGFKERWRGLNGAEFLEEMSDAVKSARPHAVLEDEAYSYFTDLSAAGSDGVYGKNTHDERMGQIGLYDVLRDAPTKRNFESIRDAMRNVAFRLWQLGGAAVVNFIGNHDEQNPVNVFGRYFRAAAATALLAGPVITYNGMENGVDQKTMLGELKSSGDMNKAIPFDIPVSIQWDKVDPGNRDFLRALLVQRHAHKELLRHGVMDVLEPYIRNPGGAGFKRDENNSIVAYTVGGAKARNGAREALLVAANFGPTWSHAWLRMDEPVLRVFGAFKPARGRKYIFRDHADRTSGSPKIYERSGEELLGDGLYIGLPAGGVHIFEIEEKLPLDPTILKRLRQSTHAAGQTFWAGLSGSLAGIFAWVLVNGHFLSWSLNGRPAFTAAVAVMTGALAVCAVGYAGLAARIGQAMWRFTGADSDSRAPPFFGRLWNAWTKPIATTYSSSPALSLMPASAQAVIEAHEAAHRRGWGETAAYLGQLRHIPSYLSGELIGFGRATKPWLRAPWGAWVDRLVYAALVPFLVLQIPQIYKNAIYLATDPVKVSILSWVGYSVGILANSNLWSYHIDGKRHPVAFVQGAGVITSSIVLAQIFLSGAMPSVAALSMAALIGASVSLNGLRWVGWLSDNIWKAWNSLSTLLGLFALPMGFSVTFSLMNNHPVEALAASAAFASAGASAMFMQRRGKLPEKLEVFWATLGAWLGTLLFVFLPIPGLMNNFKHPENIAGIAIPTLLLSTLGNIFEVTGATWHKNPIWFTGSFWAVMVGGWGGLLSLYLLSAISPVLFWTYSLAVSSYLGWMIRQTKRNHPDSSYWQTLRFIFLGNKPSLSDAAPRT